MTCGRCLREHVVVARVRWKIAGEWKRTKPLCLLCRCDARRLFWRKGATAVITETCPQTPAA
jgi:hypothetical protein